LPFVVDLSVEATNILVVCCLDDPLSLVGTFVSLVIICEFDNFVLDSIRSESFAQLLDAD